MNAGDGRLALLLAQASGPLQHRHLVLKQLQDWAERQADHFISRKRLKIYALLAGTMVWPEGPQPSSVFADQVFVCEQLPWLRALGVYLWYGCPATASVADVINAFDGGFSSDVQPQVSSATAASAVFAAPAPLPW